MGYRAPDKDEALQRRDEAEARLEKLALDRDPRVEKLAKREARARRDLEAGQRYLARRDEKRRRERVRDSIAGNVTIWRDVGLCLATPALFMACVYLYGVSAILGGALAVIGVFGVLGALVAPTLLLSRERRFHRVDATLDRGQKDGTFALESREISSPSLYAQGEGLVYLHRSGRGVREWLRALVEPL
jgi:hypothetical protein